MISKGVEVRQLNKEWRPFNPVPEPFQIDARHPGPDVLRSRALLLSSGRLPDLKFFTWASWTNAIRLGRSQRVLRVESDLQYLIDNGLVQYNPGSNLYQVGEERIKGIRELAVGIITPEGAYKALPSHNFFRRGAIRFDTFIEVIERSKPGPDIVVDIEDEGYLMAITQRFLYP